MTVETVVYKGIRFRRYPDAKQQSDQRYYTPGIADRQAGVKRLHEEIWMDVWGQRIPPDFHVHHVDHDYSNNDPLNLVCIPKADHLKHHGQSPRSDRQVEWWAECQQRAAAWHGSPDGIAWHRQQGRRSWEGRQPVAATCEQCGEDFQSLQPGRFCSNKCKTARRLATGTDNETRACAWCGSPFTVNKYTPIKCCSRSCGTSLMHANRRAAV